MTEKSFSEALSTSATSTEKRSSLSIPVTSPRTNEEDSTAFSQNTVADNSKTQAREQRASSLASPFSFAGSLWTCSSSESVTGNSGITGNAMDTATLAASLLPSWSTPTPTIENTPRRASLSTGASASWKCVGAGASASAATTVEDVINGSIGGSIGGASNTTTTARQRSASLSALTSATTNSFASIVSSTKPLLSASEDDESGVLDPVDEAVELFKRTSMDSLLDFPATSSSNANAFSQSTLLSGLSAAHRRHSLNWISSMAPEIAPGIAPGKSAAFTTTNTPSLFDDLPDFSTGGSVLETPSSHPSSPEFDTFPEDFMAASNAVTAASSNFSKKRFARRHSIATDMALEESFASFSFDQSAGAGASSNAGSINAYPFNGNVMAAYSGLLCEDGNNGSNAFGTTCTSTNTCTSAFSNSFAHNDTIINSMLKYANASAASGATPAQAGIAPTALSFPHATFNLQAHKGMLFLIEFKAGRTEIFYVLDADVALSVKVGDLVIVEADRGEDLGRITGEMPGARIRQLIAQLPHDSLSSALASQFDDSVAANGANVNHNLAGLKDFEIAALIASKEISPKRIHRHATPMDVRFLQAKAQEEALAMVRCQARIKQKKLPMEVVDAEYQWY